MTEYQHDSNDPSHDHGDSDAMAAYERATGHTVDGATDLHDGVCPVYDEGGPNTLMDDGQPQCAGCGYMKSEHDVAEPTPVFTPEEQAQAAMLADFTADFRAIRLTLLQQEEITTPEGIVYARYTMGFVNNDGKLLSAAGPDGAAVLAFLQFSNDTGRRTLATARRPRPGDVANMNDWRNGLGRR